MLENKKISIILPVYNGERFLAQSISSCLEQTYSNLELIIVNDCSTDNSLEIAESFASQDSRIKIISNDINKKLPASLNIGHKIARGDFLTWTSDDNYFEPRALELLAKELNSKDIDIVYSDFRVIKEQTGITKEIYLNTDNSLLLGNAVGVCFIYKKEVFYLNNGYKEHLHTVEDYDFWLRASIHSKFTHLPKVIYNYRNHEESLSANREQQEPAKREFRSKLLMSYLDFFDNFGLKKKEEYAELLTTLHLYEELNIIPFLRYYNIFKEDMKFICKKTEGLNLSNLFLDIDKRLRSQVLHRRTSQNLKTLAYITGKHPMLLLKYDRKNTLKFLKKIMKNSFHSASSINSIR